MGREGYIFLGWVGDEWDGGWSDLGGETTWIAKAVCVVSPCLEFRLLLNVRVVEVREPSRQGIPVSSRNFVPGEYLRHVNANATLTPIQIIQ